MKGYYAAYVLDPMGNNVEAVYFNPWWLQVMKGIEPTSFLLTGAFFGVVLSAAFTKNYGWL